MFTQCYFIKIILNHLDHLLNPLPLHIPPSPYEDLSDFHDPYGFPRTHTIDPDRLIFPITRMKGLQGHHLLYVFMIIKKFTLFQLKPFA